MNCKDLEGTLLEYFGRNINWGRPQNLEKHAKQCHDCRALMNTYRRTILLSGQILPKEPPLTDLYPQIRQRLSDQLLVTAETD